LATLLAAASASGLREVFPAY